MEILPVEIFRLSLILHRLRQPDDRRKGNEQHQQADRQNPLAEPGIHQDVVPVFIEEVKQRDIAYQKESHGDEFLERLIHQVFQLGRHDPHIGIMILLYRRSPSVRSVAGNG